MKTTLSIITAALVSGAAYGQSYEEQKAQIERDYWHQVEHMDREAALRESRFQHMDAMLDAACRDADRQLDEALRDWDESLQALNPKPIPVYIIPRPYWAQPTDCE